MSAGNYDPGTGEENANPTGPTSSAIPPAGRPSWLIPVIVVAVVVIAGLGYYFTVGPGAPGSSSGPKSTPLVNVTSVIFTGQDVAISSPCGRCFQSVAPGQEFNVSVKLTPACNKIGCAPEVASVSVAAPFLVASTTPAMPALFPTSGPLSVVVTIGAPETAGLYNVTGTIDAVPPPAPVVLQSTAFFTTYVGLDAGYLASQATNLPTEVRPGGNVTVDVNLVSTSRWDENVTSLAVNAPFSLISTTPSLPLTIGPNGSVGIQVNVDVPSVAGSYTVNGSIIAGPTPVVTVGNVTFQTSSSLGFFYLPGYNLSPVLPQYHWGQQFTWYITFYNNDSVNHSWSFSSVRSPWIFDVVIPSGNVTIASGGHNTWAITITAPARTGKFDLIAAFIQTS